MNIIGNERECAKCKWMHHITEYTNKEGIVIYSRCIKCRRDYIRSYQAERRSKLKSEKPKIESPKPIHQDSLTRLRHYLLRHAGYLCQACGHNHKLNLKLINLDGSPLSDVLNMYNDNMNHDSWSAVIEVYKRCILMCDDCADAFYHDEAFKWNDDMLWKANPYPKQPE